MRKLFAALFVTFGFAVLSSASALDGTHIFIQSTVDSSGRVIVGFGPEYLEQYKGKTVDEGMEDIATHFSDGQVICVANKSEAGMNFLMTTRGKPIPSLLVGIGNGTTTVLRLDDMEHVAVAVVAVGEPPSVLATVPNEIMNDGLSDAAIAALLKDVQDYLAKL